MIGQHTSVGRYIYAEAHDNFGTWTIKSVPGDLDYFLTIPSSDTKMMTFAVSEGGIECLKTVCENFLKEIKKENK